MRVDRAVVLVLLAAVFLLPACSPSGPQVDPEVEANWTWLTENKERLDSLRAELAEVEALRKAPAAEPAGDAEAAQGEPQASAQELAARAGELDKTLTELADEFSGKLTAFLNDPRNQILEGEPLTERQQAAIRMKSSEDVNFAAEYIDKGGDYRRAIDILTMAASLDPDNAEVQAALADAEANRFMSEERFAAAKKGMTQDQVRDVLGQVNLRNIREYPERGVVAWFYATAEGGAAAAVWFRENKKTAELEVYQLKYDAVSGSGESTE